MQAKEEKSKFDKPLVHSMFGHISPIQPKPQDDTPFLKNDLKATLSASLLKKSYTTGPNKTFEKP